MSKPVIDMITFPDIKGKQHTFKRSSYSGHKFDKGRWFIRCNGSIIEVCKCQVTNYFQKQGLIDETLSTFYKPISDIRKDAIDLSKKEIEINKLNKTVKELQAQDKTQIELIRSLGETITKLKEENLKLKNRTLIKRILNNSK